jgi:hypothetical protein
MDEIEKRRKSDRERKRIQRRLNTPYAERCREAKRSEGYKERRRQLRRSQDQKDKEAAYAREYRKRPEVIAKIRARTKLTVALNNGTIIRPRSCDLCGSPDTKLNGGRSALRADHYEGYENPLTVRFVCVSCDGLQERQRANTTLGKIIAND